MAPFVTDTSTPGVGKRATGPLEPRPAVRSPSEPDQNEIARLLRLRLPVIVRLAHRLMSVRTIRKLAPGSIIEFDKSVDQELDLLINNHPIGRGSCVKIGERFGLRLTQVDDHAQRIRSMGR